MHPDHEPNTGPLNFIASTALAIGIIAVGFGYSDYESYELEEISAEFVEEAPADQSLTKRISAEEQVLEQRVSAYYQAYLANDEDGAYEIFTEDALLDYKMDFGPYYEPVEYSFRANEPYVEDDSTFAGYEVLSSEFEIRSVKSSEAGGVVKARLKQRYRWDGYEGVLTANERFTFKNVYDGFYVVQFRSTQTYR